MAPTTDSNKDQRRPSRVQVERMAPKWIPLTPPAPMAVALADIQAQMSMAQNRKTPRPFAATLPPESSCIPIQPKLGEPGWRNSTSAPAAGIAFPQGTRPVFASGLPRPPSPVSANASFTPHYNPWPDGPAPTQSELQHSSPSPVTQQGLHSPTLRAPHVSFSAPSINYCRPFAEQPASDFRHSFLPRNQPWSVQDSMTESPKFQSIAKRQLGPQFLQGTPVTEPGYRAAVSSGMGRIHEEKSAAPMADATKEPRNILLGQEGSAERLKGVLSNAALNINSSLCGSRPEPNLSDPGASGQSSTFSYNAIPPGPHRAHSKELSSQPWLADTFQGRNLTDNKLETQKQSPIHEGPYNQQGTTKKTNISESTNLPQSVKENLQQPVGTSPKVDAGAVNQEGEGIKDEEVPIVFEKRLSDPYALKDPSRWRPNDYEGYPELKRIRDEHEEQFLRKSRSQAMIPILRARERIQMAKSHHEEARNQQKEADMFGELCMRLLKPVGALTGWIGKFGLWAKHLRQIEGHFGSAIMMAFAFLQWALLFNCILAAIWIILIVIPFCIAPPKTFSWHQFYHAGLRGVLQTNGVDLTFLLYGGYSYTEDEKHGMAEQYAATVVLMLIASLIAVAFRMIQNLQAGRFQNAYKTTSAYPFSTIVFTSWDFHITSHDTATTLRRTIRMEIHQMLGDLKDPPVEGFVRNIFLTRKRCISFLLASPAIFAFSVSITILLAIKDWGINRKLRTNLAQSAILSTVHILSSVLTKELNKMENWKPRTAEHVLRFKLYALQVGYLIALFSRLFIMMKEAQHQLEGKAPYAACDLNGRCEFSGFVCCTSVVTTLPWGNMVNGVLLIETDIVNNKTLPLKRCVYEQVGKCVPACVENAVGKQLLRLAFTSALIQNVTRFCVRSFKKYVLKIRVVMGIEDMTLGVIYTQALVWVGSCFSPVAPLLALFYITVTFYGEKMTMMRTCDPAGRKYSVSRSSNATYGLLTLTLFGCTFMIAIVLWHQTGDCGPVPGRSLSEALEIPLEKLPSGMGLFLRWVTSVFVWGSLFCISIVYHFLQRVKLRQVSQSLWVTQQELDVQYRKYNTLVLEQDAMIRSCQGPGIQPFYSEDDDQNFGIEGFRTALDNAGPLPSTTSQRQTRFRRSLTQRPKY